MACQFDPKLKALSAFIKGIHDAESGADYETNPFFMLFVPTSAEEIAWSLGFNSWYMSQKRSYITKSIKLVTPPTVTLQNWHSVLEEN